MVASLAPSYPAAFDVSEPLSVISALRAIGFSIVEETVSVMEEVVKIRLQAIGDSNPRSLPLLSSSCSRVTGLIKERYPQLEERLVPRLSPMSLHVRSLKERYGNDCVVVFIGPCTHKRSEAERVAATGGTPPDLVLTFDDLGMYFRKLGFHLASFLPSEPDGETPDWARASVLVDSLSGWNQVIETLANVESAASGHDHGLGSFIEMLACEGGCLSGDGMGSSLTLPLQERQGKIISYFKSMFQCPLRSPL